MRPVVFSSPSLQLPEADSLPPAPVLLGLGDDLNMAAVADTGESLPSEPIRRQGLQVVELAELARCVSHAQQGQVVTPDTVAVIGDLDKLESAFLDIDLDRRRPSIQRVLQQLFDGVTRPMYDLRGES